MSEIAVGVIGSGNIGSGVARLASRAGVRTVLANSRGPASLAGLVSDLGEDATAGTVEQAIAGASIVVLAVPFAAAQDLPVRLLEGKVVLDATNYYPDRDGHVASLDAEKLTSSEFLATRLVGARLVKGMNNVDFVRLPQLSRPEGSSERSALPIAGDDAEAKLQVAAFLDVIGFDALDLGPLREGRRSQPGMPIYVAPYSRPAETETDDPMQRFLTAIAVPVPLATARELTNS